MGERFARHHPDRYYPDPVALHEGFRTDACFVCEIAAKKRPAYLVYEDDTALAFLDAYPRQYGYTLVAPKRHVEAVTGDFTLAAYLELQTLVYVVSEAIRQEVRAERMYIFTFGSNQGNAHVHWHVAPLPPGTPYDEQQGAAVSWQRGVLKVPEEEMRDLAGRLGERVKRLLDMSGGI